MSQEVPEPLFFEGEISDVKVYSRALLSEEIKRVFNGEGID